MERWSRARRKTERLIDFDGSSGVPQRDHTYSCQPTSCQFSARFYDYSCLGVAEETFTRHKRPASQICSPPVVVSDNSFHSSPFLLPFPIRSLAKTFSWPASNRQQYEKPTHFTWPAEYSRPLLVSKSIKHDLLLHLFIFFFLPSFLPSFLRPVKTNAFFLTFPFFFPSPFSLSTIKRNWNRNGIFFFLHRCVRGRVDGIRVVGIRHALNSWMEETRLEETCVRIHFNVYLLRERFA